MTELILQTVLGQETAFYDEGDNAKGLIVCFSALDATNKFNRVSWFKSKEDRHGYSVLYLTDPTYSYYHGEPGKPMFHTYRKIIEYFSRPNKEGDAKPIHTVGSSMGGYAAIYFAFKLKLTSAIVGVPQTSKNNALVHPNSNWITAMKAATDQWIDLELLLQQPNNALPNLYVEYGNYPADKLAAQALVDLYKGREGLIITRKGSSNDHDYFLTANTVTTTACYFDNQDFKD